MLKELNETSWIYGALEWTDYQPSPAFRGMENGHGLVDKVNDDKAARDVDDIAALFEELVGEEDLSDALAAPGKLSDWVAGLEADAANIADISDVFEALAADQALMGVYESDGDTVEAEEADEDMEVEEEENSAAITVQIIPAPPSWVGSAPIDPRSCIRTPVFSNLDVRIPRVSIPLMDLAPRSETPLSRLSVSQLRVGVSRPRMGASCMHVSPKADVAKKTTRIVHDSARCWICKSDKSVERKGILHRYQEKRHRRNWKKGPRYSGRSHVAVSRVRNGGRFIQTAHWV